MKKEIISKLHNSFESAVKQTEDVEFWFARELQTLLGYNEWRNFLKVISKAKIACESSKQKVIDHFVDVNNMVDVGSGAKREIDDIILTRYACYLIAQNGDPKKDEIAFAMNYFAVQTRKQELLEQRLKEWERLQAREKLTISEKELSGLIFQKGIDNIGFGRIRSKGDQALFGGNTTVEMKIKLGVPDNRPLADFLPTITIKAKDFANELTNVNIRKSDLNTERDITTEHVKNNTDVRELLIRSGIKPEKLPPEADIKKIERKVQAEDKQLLKNTKKLEKELVGRYKSLMNFVKTISKEKKMNRMNLLLVAMLPIIAYCQTFTKMKDTSAFNKKVRTMGTVTKTLESDFTQVKTLKVMKNKVSCNGKLYFKKNNMLRWEYTNPFSYIIVLNKNKVSIKSDNKVKRYDLEKNKVFKEINDILLSCVQGTILASGKFIVSYFEGNTGYKIELIPRKETMKKTLNKITLFLDNQVISVTKMEMFEPSGDFTAISFSGKKINENLPDETFVLK